MRGDGVVGRRLPGTPRSKVRSALRALWLRSRERVAALKRDQYTCQCCGKKQSRAKGREVFVEVNHRNGIEWEELINLVYERLLIDPAGLETLCVKCHDKLHKDKGA